MSDEPVEYDITEEPWASIKHLLDNYNGSIRVQRPLCNEDLLGSLCVTFMKLQSLVENSSILPVGANLPADMTNAVSTQWVTSTAATPIYPTDSQK